MMENSNAYNTSELAKNVVDVSNALATRLYPERLLVPVRDDFLGTWHVQNPDFSKPDMQFLGYDISDKLYELAQKSDDLLVELQLCIEDYDNEDEILLAHYNWAVNTPSEYIEGLEMSITCPVIMYDTSIEAIKKTKKRGDLKINSGGWYNPKDPKTGFLNEGTSMISLIRKDLNNELYLIHWFLDGINKSMSTQEVDQDYFGDITDI